MRNYIKDKRNRAIIALIVLLVVNAKKLRFCGCNLIFDERYYKRDKNGRFAKGASLEELKSEAVKNRDSHNALISITPHIELYNALLKHHNGDVFNASKEFFRIVFQGTHIQVDMHENGKQIVFFTGGTWGELKGNIHSNSMNAEIIPYLAEIITTGEYIGLTEQHHTHKNINNFHSYHKKILTSQGMRDAIVDIAEREKGNEKYIAYSFNLEGTPNYKFREEQNKKRPIATLECLSGRIQRHPTPTGDENKVATSFEIVNIRFAA